MAGPDTFPPLDNWMLHNIVRITLHQPCTLLSTLGPSFSPTCSHTTLTCHVTLTISLVHPHYADGSVQQLFASGIMGYVSLFGGYLSKGRSRSAQK